MSTADLLLQQVINGLSLGAMYSLLALGFTLVYGILELINFSHFNVFMVGSFVAMWTLQLFGLTGQDIVMTGLPLAGVLLVALVVTMGFSGALGVLIERVSLRPLRNVPGPAAMITTMRAIVVRRAWRRRQDQIELNVMNGIAEAYAYEGVPSMFELVKEDVNRFITITVCGGYPTPMNTIYV